MAKFEEEKVITALHPEKAEIGKKYLCSDSLLELKRDVETSSLNNEISLISVEEGVDKPFMSYCMSRYQFLYPYEEPPKQRMTNIQLMEWISKRNGIFKYEDGSVNCFVYMSSCEEKDLNNEVDEDIVIRSWDSKEWIEPTVDIYERDCKGGKE